MPLCGRAHIDGARPQAAPAAAGRCGAPDRRLPCRPARDSRPASDKAAWGSAVPDRHRAARTAGAQAALASARRASPPKSSSAKRNTAARGRSITAWLMKDSTSTSQPGLQRGLRDAETAASRFWPMAAASAIWAPRFLRECMIWAPARVGDHQGAVGRAGIADDHFAHHPAHRGRDQAVEAARQQAFGIVGGNDDGNHDCIMTKMLLRTTLLRSQGERLNPRNICL